MSGIPIVGVMGSGARPHAQRAAALGRWLAESGVHLLTGGGGGVMAAVSEAFSQVPDRRGQVIGVLPGVEATGSPPAGYPNEWVELAVRTHLPLRGDRGAETGSRNHINILTSDVIVALPGGAGTLSEIGLAVRYGRPVIAFLETEAELPGLPPDVAVSGTLEGVQRFVLTHLSTDG